MPSVKSSRSAEREARIGCGQGGRRRFYMEINVIKVFVIAFGVCVCVSALMPVKSDVYAFMTHSAERVPEPHPRRGPETVACSTFANMLIALGVPGTAACTVRSIRSYLRLCEHACRYKLAKL